MRLLVVGGGGREHALTWKLAQNPTVDKIFAVPGNAGIQDVAQCEPMYEELDGWDEDISGARAYADLPPAAQRYVRRVEEIAGVPVTWISVGPEREQLVSTSTVAV